MELISLVEYAELNGIDSATARQRAIRGSFKTARKIGRNWVIDKNELLIDNRKKEDKTMETYYYEVIGNFGNGGEENGTNYKTLADAKKRINELGDQYESYTVLKVNADDKFDFEEVEI